MTAFELNLPPAIRFTSDQKVISTSPYPCHWNEFKQRFATNSKRLKLAENFEKWVKELKSVVLPEFVWIGGSYASNKLEPKDLDAVVFYRYRQPFDNAISHTTFLTQNSGVLSPVGVKKSYGIDCAIVALSMPIERLIAISAEWTMILSGNPDGTRRAFYSIPATSIL
jgi:hypothetical protein